MGITAISKESSELQVKPAAAKISLQVNRLSIVLRLGMGTLDSKE
jgi:hypothetical protein